MSLILAKAGMKENNLLYIGDIMINIKILGSGCANCKTTVKLISDAVNVKGVTAQIDKVEEIKDIVSYGVMNTPGVVIDGKVVHSGGVPSIDKINSWF